MTIFYLTKYKKVCYTSNKGQISPFKERSIHHDEIKRLPSNARQDSA